MYRMPFPGPGTAREAWVVMLSSPVYINGIRASGISVAVWRRKTFFSLCPSSQPNRLHLYEFIYVPSQKVIINWLVRYWPPPIQEWDVEGHCALTQASVHSSKPVACLLPWWPAAPSSQERAGVPRLGRKLQSAALGKTLTMLPSDPFWAAALESPRILSTNAHLCFVNKTNKFTGSPGWVLFAIRAVEGGWGIA